jgi:hypothetical protein
MPQTVAEATPELMHLTITDWDDTRRAHLEDVPRNATVAEILEEARRAMELSTDTSYQLLAGGRQLNQMESLSEAGIESGAELEILPEVHAG